MIFSFFAKYLTYSQKYAKIRQVYFALYRKRKVYLSQINHVQKQGAL